MLLSKRKFDENVNLARNGPSSEKVAVELKQRSNGLFVIFPTHKKFLTLERKTKAKLDN